MESSRAGGATDMLAGDVAVALTDVGDVAETTRSGSDVAGPAEAGGDEIGPSDSEREGDGIAKAGLGDGAPAAV
jgi:hypothetical protein